jgi:hypothetical protein
MSKKTRNVLLLAKVETIYGTDPTPTAALNAMHAKVTSYQPTMTEFKERENVRNFFGSGGQVQASNHSEMDIEVELAGSGTAGTAPAYAALLKACGLKETVSAGLSVIYSPDTDAPVTVTFYYNLDGIRHTMTGARGNMTLDMTARGIPMLKFHFTGLYTAVADQPMPTGADYDAFLAPLAVNKVNTPSWSIHGTSGAMQSFTADLGNNVVYRNLIGSESVVLTDRKITGQASFEMTAVAVKAWHEAVRLGTLDDFTLVHGSVAGQIIQIDGPKVQLTNPQYADSDGIQMLNVALDFQPDAGDDEFTLTLK